MNLTGPLRTGEGPWGASDQLILGEVNFFQLSWKKNLNCNEKSLSSQDLSELVRDLGEATDQLIPGEG